MEIYCFRQLSMEKSAISTSNLAFWESRWVSLRRSRSSRRGTGEQLCKITSKTQPPLLLWIRKISLINYRQLLSNNQIKQRLRLRSTKSRRSRSMPRLEGRRSFRKSREFTMTRMLRLIHTSILSCSWMNRSKIKKMNKWRWVNQELQKLLLFSRFNNLRKDANRP